MVAEKSFQMFEQPIKHGAQAQPNDFQEKTAESSQFSGKEYFSESCSTTAYGQNLKNSAGAKYQSFKLKKEIDA